MRCQNYLFARITETWLSGSECLTESQSEGLNARFKLFILTIIFSENVRELQGASMPVRVKRQLFVFIWITPS